RPQQPSVVSEKPAELPFVPGVAPNFTQHFKARWLAGGWPWSGIQKPDSVIELGMRDQGNATESHVVAMADFLPPIATTRDARPRQRHRIPCRRNGGFPATHRALVPEDSRGGGFPHVDARAAHRRRKLALAAARWMAHR